MLNAYFPERPFVEAAEEFCSLIEEFESHHRSEWLGQIGNSLLRLESAVAELEMPSAPSTHAGLSDLDKRFELYTRLKHFLREQDDYWSEADLLAADGYMTGSLSDDFTDIYFELKRGLSLHGQNAESANDAIKSWTQGYRDHWRQHLIDARKQLFDLRDRSESSSSPAFVISRSIRPPKTS